MLIDTGTQLKLYCTQKSPSRSRRTQTNIAYCLLLNYKPPGRTARWLLHGENATPGLVFTVFSATTTCSLFPPVALIMYQQVEPPVQSQECGDLYIYIHRSGALYIYLDLEPV